MIDPEGYRPRVERALRYIADNLERELTLAEVAKLAHLSEFHYVLPPEDPGRDEQLGLADEDVDAWGIAHDSPKLTVPLPRLRPCPSDFVPPAPLFRARIPAGRHAVFRYVGEVAGVERMVRAIDSPWLPRSGVEVDDFTPLDHYVNDGPVEGKVDFEMWIKKRESGRGEQQACEDGSVACTHLR